MDTPSLPDISLKHPDKVALRIIVVIGLLLLAAGGWGLYLLMPLLIELAKNTLVFLLLLTACGVVLLGLVQAWFLRHTLVYKLKLIARNARKALVKSDPIGVIDVGIHHFEERLEEIDTRMLDADTAQKTLANRITNVKRTGVSDNAENEETLAMQAKQSGQPTSIVNLHLVSAERWRQAEAQLKPMLEAQKSRQGKLREARQLADVGLMNLKNQKAVLSVQLDAAKAEAAQARAFSRFFGNNEDLEMIDLAVEEAERQAAECEAQVEQMLRQAEPLMAKEQLQNEVDAARAQARIDKALPVGKAPEQLTTSRESAKTPIVR
jgi:hypothetical protein